MTKFQPQKFGKYYLLEKLAVGGMAEIYKAKTFGAEGFEKLLAIKRILPHAAEDKEFINMLIDEAKLSVLLSHANIVQVYDLGKVGQDYFISMEFIHGINFREMLYRLREKNRKLPTELAVYIGSEICKGLDYAHRKTNAGNQPLDIVHRDISPQNILISFEGEIKIVDFGIAKAAMNISHTMAGILKGKIAYMSPEQAMGKQIDARTDIFSLGILLYEALTQQKLFTGESQFEVLKKIRTTHVSVANLPAGIPEPLKLILAKALAFRVEDRYASASDMQIALTKYLYFTYTDFSPRRISAFVRNLFLEELKTEERETDKIKILDIKTSSMNLAGPTQENIVHREITPTGKKGTAFPNLASKSITASDSVLQSPKRRWVFVTGFSLLAAAGLLFAIYKYLPPPPKAPVLPPVIVTKPPETPPVKIEPIIIPQVQTGTLLVETTPPGAKIFVNNEDTQKTTPAKLDALELGKDFSIRLEKENFAPLEKEVTLKDPALVTLSEELSPLPPPLVKGSLRVTSNPSGAVIYLNGRNTNKVTPATLGDLPQGKYTVKLHRKEYQSAARSVRIASSKQYDVSITLKEIATIPPPIKVTPPKEPDKPVITGGMASIQITSTPSGGDIYVDGQHRGTTPSTIQASAGSLNILVTRGGDTLPCRRSLTVAAGKSASVHCLLGELHGQVSINTNPPRAEVFLDGKKLGGKTPLVIRKIKRDTDHTLRIELNGYKAWGRSFSLRDKASTSFDVQLEKM